MSSNLVAALLSGGGVVTIIGAIAKYLPQSKTEAMVRADKLTAEAIERLTKDNDDLRRRVQVMEDTHDADETQASKDRRRVAELEAEVDRLTRKLERAEFLAAEKDRPDGLRTRQSDLPPNPPRSPRRPGG